MPEETEVALLGRYVQGRRAGQAEFDGPTFIKSYVTLAAQRASKILGIFARLDAARRQAAIFATHAARMGLSAAFARPPVAGDAQRVV